MTGPLTDAIFPTTADLLNAAWIGWWREHKLPPSPDQLLTHAAGAFWEWRAEIMQQHSDCLTDRLGDRLLPLYDLVIDLVLERVDCRGWEFPDPETEPDDVIICWTAWALTCLRWTLVYEVRDQPEVTYAEASAFLLEAKRRPPPRSVTPAYSAAPTGAGAGVTPPQPQYKPPRPGQTAVWPQPTLF